SYYLLYLTSYLETTWSVQPGITRTSYPLRSWAGADKPNTLVPDLGDDLQVPGGFLQPEPVAPEAEEDDSVSQEGYDGRPELLFTREMEPPAVGSRRDETGSEIPKQIDHDNNRDSVIANEYARRTPRRKLSNEDLVNVYHDSLSPEQRNTIDFAFGSMSFEDRQCVMARHESVAVEQDGGEQYTSEISDEDKGSSEIYTGPPMMSKGKATDPANWGNLRFAEEEMDPQIQADMLMAFNIGNTEENNEHDDEPDEALDECNGHETEVTTKDQGTSKTKDKHAKKKSKKNKRKREPTEEQSEVEQTEDSKEKSIDSSKKKKKRKSLNKGIIRPSNHIAKKSSLGQSFERLRRMQSRAPYTESDDDPSDMSRPRAAQARTEIDRQEAR
ncbi:hypothetical protein H0H92_003617, partial [Tricholoma furcatifolium]